jgi:hypothetical protein
MGLEETAEISNGFMAVAGMIKKNLWKNSQA